MAIELFPESEQEALDAYSNLVVTVAERVLPSVASVQVRRGGGERGGGSGSAVALTPDGFLVTSAHVVAGASQGTASFIDGRELPIDVVGADPLSDLAVIRARAGGLQAVELGDAEKLRSEAAAEQPNRHGVRRQNPKARRANPAPTPRRVSVGRPGRRRAWA